jgi:DAK2 domain fusion protein YloV
MTANMKTETAPPPSLPTNLKTCDGRSFKRLVGAGLAWLERHYQVVNQLNVFPVPDGDTGTNMLLTLRGAYQRIIHLESDEVGIVSDRLAHGALYSSRGNSGTALSQLLLGFAKVLTGRHEFDVHLLAAGVRAASQMAYLAFQQPVEGTILTVAREIAEEIEDAAADTADLGTILARAVARGEQSVQRTPELLPILKRAGVVDSGGKGLVFILEGMLRCIRGEQLAPSEDEAVQGVSRQPAAIAPASGLPAQAQNLRNMDLGAALQSPNGHGYGYDIQFLMHGSNLDVEAIREAISQMGDSVIVIGDPSTVKVHVHSHDPGRPISFGVQWGAISDVVVEDMQEQAKEYIRDAAARTQAELPSPSAAAPKVREGDIGAVAVAPGEGLADVFRGLGVAQIVAGGQTMNPSTEQLYNAIMALDTRKIIVLPNNKNVVMAAELAARLANERDGREVAVISSRSVPQGIAAMMAFAADGDMVHVVENMKEALDGVVTGEVTTATRRAEFDGISVNMGQLIGLVNGQLVLAGEHLPTVVAGLLERMDARQRELITLYFGAQVSDEEAAALVDVLRSQYPDQEFDLINGGQPLYPYILSAE